MGENGLAAAVDPAAGAQEYLRLLEQEGARLTHILLTHGHQDHSECLGEVCSFFPAGIASHPNHPLSGRIKLQPVDSLLHWVIKTSLYMPVSIML